MLIISFRYYLLDLDNTWGTDGEQEAIESVSSPKSEGESTDRYGGALLDCTGDLAFLGVAVGEI